MATHKAMSTHHTRLVPMITEEPATTRNAYANLLNSQEVLPLLSFSLGPDGLYRCDLPSQQVVSIKEVHSESSSASSKRGGSNKSSSGFFGDAEEDVVVPRNTPQNRVEALVDKVRRSGHSPSYLLALSSPLSRPGTAPVPPSSSSSSSPAPPPDFVERNVAASGSYSSSEPVRRAEWHASHALSREVAVHNRNVRQFGMLQVRLSTTRSSIDAVSLREKAMCAFLQVALLGKNNALGKTWATISILCSRAELWRVKLEAHRERVKKQAQMQAVSAITFFLVNRLKAKRMRKQADVLIGFLRFIKRDGQIKGVAKKLKWILMKLQCLMIDHVLNNKCQVALIGKKYEKAMAKYLPEMELLRDAAEAKAERHKKAGGERKSQQQQQRGADLSPKNGGGGFGGGGSVPLPKPPLPARARDAAILHFVVTNRQEHVTRVMAYDEAMLWPALVDIVREKSIFGNPLEARKYCKKIRQKGKMYQWIVDNGGGEALVGNPPPKYRRMPTDAEIIGRIYEPGIERARMEPSLTEQLASLHLKLRKDMGLDQDDDAAAAAADAVRLLADAEAEAEEEALRAPKGRRRSTSRNSIKKPTGKAPGSPSKDKDKDRAAAVAAAAEQAVAKVGEEGSSVLEEGGSIVESVAEMTISSSK